MIVVQSSSQCLTIVPTQWRMPTVVSLIGGVWSERVYFTLASRLCLHKYTWVLLMKHTHLHIFSTFATTNKLLNNKSSCCNQRQLFLQQPFLKFASPTCISLCESRYQWNQRPSLWLPDALNPLGCSAHPLHK